VADDTPRGAGTALAVRQLAVATGWNIFGTAAGQVAGLLLTVVVARALNPEDLGVLLPALTFVAFATQAGGCGLDRVGVVDVSRAGADRGPRALGIVSVSAVGALAAAALVAVAATLFDNTLTWGTDGALTVFLALLAGVDVVRATAAELPRAWLKVFDAVALGTAGRQIVALVVVSAAALAGDLTAVETAALLAGVSGVLSVAAALRVRTLAATRTADLHVGAALARRGAPVMVAGLARGVTEQADILVVAAAFDKPTAAAYAIASRLAAALGGVTIALNITVLPLLGRAARRGSPEDRESIARVGATVASWVVVPAAIALTVVAGPVVRLLYGDSYSQVVGILQILLVAQIVNALCGVGGAVLLDGGREKALLAINVVAAVVAVLAEVAAAQSGDVYWVATANAAAFAALNIAGAVASIKLLNVRPMPFAKPRVALDHLRRAATAATTD
jgi:PST family polysaccharide transporter